uniref:Serpin domain-containing protein n=1 Tax=Rhinolophus ferrumequinum TaxID=59479 RepID=A0A671FNK8_RHIFE
MSSLSEANTRFAYDLFQQFRQSEKENIFYSPLSITSALAMTYLGSRGQTASTMQKVLHFNEVTENTKGEATKVPVEKSGDVHYQFQKLLTELNKPTDDYELNIANRLYGEKKFQFLQEYKNNVKKFYLASVESVDFVNAAEESRMMINSWVESQTNEKIKNLFPEDSLDSSTILVLVNAVYFKGQWNEKFDPKNTEQGEFWQNKLEDQLTAEKLIEWTSSQNMSKRKVELRLPRFKVEESYALEDTMRALGMGNAFTPGDADFSGMTGSRGFVLSQIVHKSFVEVTEEGTEAAAATGIVIGRTSVQMYERFHCDHPFLFFIKHNETNSILFFGRISTPD